MFKDCSFEIYKGMAPSYTNKDIYEEIGAPAKQRIEVRTPWSIGLDRGFLKGLLL